MITHYFKYLRRNITAFYRRLLNLFAVAILIDIGAGIRTKSASFKTPINFLHILPKILPILIGLSYISCESESLSQAPAELPKNSPVHFILFKKEKKMELWETGSTFKRIHQEIMERDLADLSIGVNDSLNQIQLKTYLSKFDRKISRYLVFPNDARLTGKFEVCFACPYYLASTYGKLELELKNYPEK